MRETDSQTQNLLLTTALGLQSYRLAKGRYPGSLIELIPAQLKKLPEDPFSDQHVLHYRQIENSYRLYSIGPDGKDDKGYPINSPFDDEGKPLRGIARRYIMDYSKGDILAGFNIL